MSYFSMAYMYQIVMGMYDSDKWRWRVRNMSDNQIMAIFYEHLERAAKNASKCDSTLKNVGTIGSKCDSASKKCTDEEEEFVPQQLSFFE